MRLEEELDKKIFRSSVKVSRDTLATIVGLAKDYQWLKPKADSLASLINECNSEVEASLVIHMITKFRYFDSYELNEALNDCLPKIENEWNLSPKDTVFSALARDNNLDSGTMFLGQARNRLEGEDWKKTHFHSNFSKIDYKKESWIKKIVLCDDFTGTAKTLERKVTWLRKRLTEIGADDTQVFFFGLVCMNFSISVVDNLVDNYHFCESLDKGISDHFTGDDLKRMVGASGSMEEQLGNSKKLRKLTMGFMKSESLYNLADTNIPNNVFPVLWWPTLRGGATRDRLFRRII